MRNIIVSIIVPVYRVEAYLERCVESIVSQSMAEWELILIDDGSPDGSGELCDRLEKTDERIRVIHKTNGGVSSARNCGIAQACGKYVMFVDADDWIAPNMCSLLLEEAECVDWVVAGYIEVYRDHQNKRVLKEKLHITVDELRDQFDQLYKSNQLNSPWSRLYNRKVLGDLRFNEQMTRGEDFLFNLAYVERCTYVVFLSEALYYYDLTNQESATKRLQTDDFKQLLMLYKEGKQFKYSHHLADAEQIDALDERLCLGIVNLMQLLCYSESQEKMKLMRAWMQEPMFKRSCSSNYGYSVKYRIPQLLCQWNMAKSIICFFALKKTVVYLINGCRKIKMTLKHIYIDRCAGL